jgi:branched-chain amino acid transport system ATP-binding protein
MSVDDNLDLGAYRRGNAKERKRLVYDLFPRLEERRDQHANTMSGGEQQMLAIGRALMADPDLLIADEPTLGLAPVIIDDISAAFQRLNDEGMTILLVEQNSVFAIENADYLYLLENGDIQLEGPVEEFEDNEYVQEVYLGIS